VKKDPKKHENWLEKANDFKGLESAEKEEKRPKNLFRTLFSACLRLIKG
jgi:hypothetical protein